jgi:ATP-dependent Clp protease, protease subunit
LCFCIFCFHSSFPLGFSSYYNNYTKLYKTILKNTITTGAAIGPPPDLPSLLLHNRIVYIGMPLVPAVTELIIAELLYLNYESTTEPITMYINSSGTTTGDGQSVGFETEAFAIADVMKYVRPPVHTVAIGQAFGAAAMLLSQGKRGFRFALPNATILLNQPRSMARGQASDIAIKAREVAHNRRTTCELIAKACGKPVDTVVQDCSRVKYLQPHEAVAYGLIDEVIESDWQRSTMPVAPSFMQALEQK